MIIDIIKIKHILLIFFLLFSTSVYSDQSGRENLFAGYDDNGEEKYLSIRKHDKKKLEDYVTSMPSFFFDKCIDSQDYKEASIFEVKYRTISNVVSHYFVKIKVLYDSDLGKKNVVIKIKNEKSGQKVSWEMKCKPQ